MILKLLRKGVSARSQPTQQLNKPCRAIITKNHMILPVYLDLLQHKKDYDDEEVISYKSTVALHSFEGDKELNSDTLHPSRCSGPFN